MSQQLQLEIVCQPRILYTHTYFGPPLIARLSLVDQKAGGIAGRSFTANINVVEQGKQGLGTDSNKDLLGWRNMRGDINQDNTEVTFNWTGIYFIKEDNYILEITVVACAHDPSTMAAVVRLKISTEPIHTLRRRRMRQW